MRYDKGVLRGLAGYGTLGLEIVLSILFGLFGGRWLDERFGTDPWLGWIGFGFGVGAAVRAVQRNIAQMKRATAKEAREQGNPAPLWESPADRAYRLAEQRRRAEFEGHAPTPEPHDDERAAPHDESPR